VTRPRPRHEISNFGFETETMSRDLTSLHLCLKVYTEEVRFSDAKIHYSKLSIIFIIKYFGHTGYILSDDGPDGYYNGGVLFILK